MPADGSWAALRATAAGPDTFEEIRQELDLVAVLLQEGVDLSPQPDGRWVGLCPFHNDSDPSFAVFAGDDGVDRAGCWSCDFRVGDVFDVLGKLRGYGRGEALREARSLLRAGLRRPDTPEGWGPSGAPVDVSPIYDAATASPIPLLLDLRAARGFDTPSDWIAGEFRVRSDGEELLLPLLDAAGKVVALKRRSALHDWKPLALRGSRLSALYGEHRDRGRELVVLCEGESDTWFVSWLLRDEEADVLGLPSGAMARPAPAWLDRLAGRDVVLLMDADDAGRGAARLWAEHLEGRARVAILPDGTDACKARERAVREAIDRAAPAKTHALSLLVTDGGYYRPARGDGEPTQVSDFTLAVSRKIELPDRVIYEVRLNGRREAVQIGTPDLGSSRALKAWCNPMEFTWKGTDADAQDLLAELAAQAAYVARARGTTVAGWHEGSFVLPGLTLGGRGWAYVPPVADVRLAEHVRLAEGRHDRGLLRQLSLLHLPEITTPILGWLGAAPLRGLCRQFPILAVTGGSGWGKTTLLEAMLHAFGYHVDVVLTATTPHAVQAFAASTNGVPVWYDEYRPGARDDSKRALDQVLRDAWDGKASAKGGQTENRSQLTFLEALAPIVVTGEDAFTETSHRERMVCVPLGKEGRDPDALRQLREFRTEGLGRAYLEWLVEQHEAGLLMAPPVEVSRPAQAQAVARWGYRLLDAFSKERLGVELPPYDGGLVARAYAEGTSPILEALAEALGVEDRAGRRIAWVEGEDVLVRLQPLVQHARRETDLVLPGGSRAVKDWLVRTFPGSAEERTPEGRAVRLRGAATEVD